MTKTIKDIFILIFVKLLCIASLALYITAAIARSSSPVVLRQLAWFAVHNDETDDITSTYNRENFGLHGVYYHSETDSQATSGFVSYDTVQTTWGHECDESGKKAFILVIVAGCMSFFAVVTSLIRLIQDNRIIMASTSILSFMAMGFGIASFAIFQSNCIGYFTDDLHNQSFQTVYLKAGGICVVSGFSVIAVAMVTNLFVMAEPISSDFKPVEDQVTSVNPPQEISQDPDPDSEV